MKLFFWVPDLSSLTTIAFIFERSDEFYPYGEISVRNLRFEVSAS
jgi:hypothetical protein